MLEVFWIDLEIKVTDVDKSHHVPIVSWSGCDLGMLPRFVENSYAYPESNPSLWIFFVVNSEPPSEELAMVFLGFWAVLRCRWFYLVKPGCRYISAGIAFIGGDQWKVLPNPSVLSVICVRIRCANDWRCRLGVLDRVHAELSRQM